jgi:hypothetical protein
VAFHPDGVGEFAEFTGESAEELDAVDADF